MTGERASGEGTGPVASGAPPSHPTGPSHPTREWAAAPVDPFDEAVVGLPAPALRPFVGHYLGYRQRVERELRRREVAGAFVVVVLGWGAPLDIVDPRDAASSAYRVDSFVAGTFDAWCTTSTVGVGTGVQLTLTPPAARRMLGVPLGELTNRALAAEQLPGGWLDRLRGRLADTPDWAGRFALLDAAIGTRLAAADPVDSALRWAWGRLAHSGGLVGVGALAEELGCSRRHLAARFRRELGLTPKTTARLLRFQGAYALLTGAPPAGAPTGPGGADERGTGPAERGGRGSGGAAGHVRRDPYGPAGRPAGAELAAACGYYDQSHLIRDFREFAGDTPAGLVGSRSHSSNPR